MTLLLKKLGKKGSSTNVKTAETGESHSAEEKGKRYLLSCE
jgi:hypothetical protein